MKRISIAEQTLKKQLDNIDAQISNVEQMKSNLDEQLHVYQTVRRDLMNEQLRLRSQREAVSKKNKGEIR